MKRVIYTILWALLLLIAIIVIRTLLQKSLQPESASSDLPTPAEECFMRLSGAIQIPTVSFDVDMPVDTFSFNLFGSYLEENFPLVHSTLTLEKFSNFSRLYKWEGSDNTLMPVILMAHIDVVPAGDAGEWEQPPFSGLDDGTFIWGRGTLDDKGAVLSMLEAAEMLISTGYKPERTIYFAYGHDEELSGKRGAGTIAAYLKEKGVTAEYVLDEGMAVTSGMVPMMSAPVALIGTSEKGYLSVKLSAAMDGGHSSTPEAESALTLISEAVAELNENQMKAAISGPVNDFIKYLGPEMPFYAHMIFANKWIFKGLLLKIYQGSSSGNALVRTTTAPTIITSGIKDNVIPTRAEAVINFRILPGETSVDVLAHVKKTIDDERITVEVIEGVREPAPVSSVSTTGFNAIALTLRQVYPEAVIAPTMMLAASDSRHYLPVSSNIYRFAPINVTSEDMARIHGLNERVNKEDYLNAVRFYYQLIKNSN